MIRQIPHSRGALLILGLLALCAATARADKSPRPIADVMATARIRDMVLIRVQATKAFDFDAFLVKDDSGELVITLEGVRHNFKVGDTLLVYGRYRGNFNYHARYARVEVVEFIAAGSTDADALIAKYGAEPVLKKSETPSSALAAPVAPPRSVEERLGELEQLKSKNLITPAEYDQERKRILDDL